MMPTARLQPFKLSDDPLLRRDAEPDPVFPVQDCSSPLTPLELHALADFLDDIAVAFEALYREGDITAVEYLDAILAEFDRVLQGSEEQDLSPNLIRTP